MNIARINFFLVCSCFWLSGLAALIYQTAWLRRFSIVFGTSELAVVVVLSSYMAGLALGAMLAARIIDRISRPVLFYGVLEAVIAGVALMFPILLEAIQWLFTSLFGNQQNLSNEIGLWQSVYYFVGVFVVILIPTTAMGATLPVLSKYVVSKDQHIAGRIGFLYAINTIGAVIGTLLTAFVLLPALGLRGSIYCAIALNFAVFVAAVVLEKFQSRQGASAYNGPSPSPAPGIALNWRGLFLVAILVSGSVSFTYEVLWTRLLSHILGGSVTAFATMLASFLTGIGLGSFIGAVLASTRQRAIIGFWICQLGIAFSSIAVYHGFEYLAGYPEQISEWSVGLAILIMLPATLFIGATFPLVVRVFAPSVAKAASSAGMVYGWNTIGAIVGAIVAGFFLVPTLKYEGTIKLAVLISLAIAVVIAFEPSVRTRLRYSITSVLAFVAVLWFYQPGMPINILKNSPIGGPQQGDVLFYEVGRSATVLVQEFRGRYFLRTNGLPEANVGARGRAVYRSQSPLVTIPALIRPAAEDALIIGLGGGHLIENVPPGIKHLDVIELEPKVLDANRFLSGLRQTDPLADERIRFYVNDARGALQLTNRRWDIVVSQPSHPWTAGSSHLYTEEFMRVIDDHLNTDGVYLQWMNVSFVSGKTLASLVRSLNNVFAYVRIYQMSPGVFYFLSSQTPIVPEQQYFQAGRTATKDFIDYRAGGIPYYHDLFGKLLMDEHATREFSSDAPPITDERNYMATDSLRAVQTKTAVANSEELLLMNVKYNRSLHDWEWLRQYLQQPRQWIGLHNSLLFGKDKFLDQLKTEHPQWAQYIESGQRLSAQNQLISADSRPQLDTDLSPGDFSWLNFLQILEDFRRNTQADPQLLSGFEALPKSAQAALRAQHWLVRKDYLKIRQIDDILSQVEPLQPWYVLAMQAQIAWRMDAMQRPDHDARVYAHEAKALMDEMVYYTTFDGWLNLYIETMKVLRDYETVSGVSHKLVGKIYNLILTNSQASFYLISPKVGTHASYLAQNQQQIEDLRKTINDLVKREVSAYGLATLIAKTEKTNLRLHQAVLYKGHQKTLFVEEVKQDLSWGEVPLGSEPLTSPPIP